MVTGGAGFIGSHTICELLEAGGYEVVSVDDFRNSIPKTFDRIEEITGHRVQNESIDISQIPACKGLFERHPDTEAIIHFAALKAVGESVNDPLSYYRNNLNSTINLLEEGVKVGVKHFVFSSSCTIYGNPDKLPVNEDCPVGKIESPYGFTKLVGERILQDLIASKVALRGTSLRYFNPVGAHPSGKLGELPLGVPNNLVPLITQTAIGIRDNLKVLGSDYSTPDGTAIRDYIHVCDIAKAHVLALKYSQNQEESNGYEVFNLGTGTGVSVLEIIQAFERSTGVKLNYEMADRRAGDVEAIYADATKARDLLGWTTRSSLDEMMASAWKWQQNLAT